MSTKTSQYLPPDTEKGLVLAWMRRARESQMAHYEMANMFSRRDKWFGVPVIIIAAIIGTSAFSSVAADAIPIWTKLVVGLFGILAAVLSSLQTFFKFSELSEKHKVAGANFGSLRRKFEIIYAQNKECLEQNYINALREETDNLAKESPHVPVSVFEKIQKNDFYAGKIGE